MKPDALYKKVTLTNPSLALKERFVPSNCISVAKIDVVVQQLTDDGCDTHAILYRDVFN
jgi:hypothetical protein